MPEDTKLTIQVNRPRPHRGELYLIWGQLTGADYPPEPPRGVGTIGDGGPDWYPLTQRTIRVRSKRPSEPDTSYRDVEDPHLPSQHWEEALFTTDRAGYYGFYHQFDGDVTEALIEYRAEWVGDGDYRASTANVTVERGAVYVTINATKYYPYNLARNETFHIYGNVTNGHGFPLPHAHIDVYYADASDRMFRILRTTNTDFRGFYSIEASVSSATTYRAIYKPRDSPYFYDSSSRRTITVTPG